jgi:hypothetical protein
MLYKEQVTNICGYVLLVNKGQVNNYQQHIFTSYYNTCKKLTPFFKFAPLLFDALGPLSHNLLYAPKIKSYALRTNHECAASFSC